MSKHFFASSETPLFMISYQNRLYCPFINAIESLVLEHRVLFCSNVVYSILKYLLGVSCCRGWVLASSLSLTSAAWANCFICSLLPDIGGGGLPITLILQHYINHSVIVITQSFLSIFSSRVHDGLNVK